MDVILDVDPGVDDALAILLAIASPELNLIGVTAVSGNVPLSRGTQNALDVLAFAGCDDIPVYAGADRPLRIQPVHAEYVHGETGLGEAQLRRSERQAGQDAVGFLVEALNRRPGDITVIAVGPLTNLARAEIASPGALSKARQIVVMGGAVREPGNASPTAEFNFYADPEAARCVIGAESGLVLVPLDVTQPIGLSENDISEFASKYGERGRFLHQATRSVVKFGGATGGYVGIQLHDPTAVAYAARPDLFESQVMFADVEAEGGLTAGQLVVDLRLGLPDDQRKGRSTRILIRADEPGVIELFRERVLENEL